MRQLLMLRHAEAVDFTPGGRDHDRPLTAAGRDQATRVGEFLSTQGFRPGRVLCSTAARTRSTAELLGLDTPAEQIAELYNCATSTIVEHCGETPDEVDCLLVVAHAPAIPALAHDLSDPARSEPRALAAIERGYPTATLTVFSVDDWENLRGAVLTDALLTSPR